MGFDFVPRSNRLTDSIAVVSLTDRAIERMLPAGQMPDGIVVLEGVGEEAP